MGFVAHGTQFNSIQNFETATFSLPDNVSVITVSVPGTTLYLRQSSFARLHSIIKGSSAGCLERLFAPTAEGRAYRKTVSRILTLENTDGRYPIDLSIYRQRCPELGLDTRQLLGRRYNAFAPFLKQPDDAPGERGGIRQGDYFPMVFFRRRSPEEAAVPIITSVAPPAPGAPLPTQNSVYWASYADSNFPVDPQLMLRYYDTTFRLSGFVQRECVDPSVQYGVLVFCCRSPTLVDRYASHLDPRPADFMDIDEDVFARRNTNTANRNAMEVNNDNRRAGDCNLGFIPHPLETRLSRSFW